VGDPLFSNNEETRANTTARLAIREHVISVKKDAAHPTPLPSTPATMELKNCYWMMAKTSDCGRRLLPLRFSKEGS